MKRDLTDREVRILQEMAKQPMAVQQAFLAMLESGESIVMAEMMATRTFPGIRGTDSIFMREAHETQRQIPDNMMQKIQEKARKAGIDTTGKYYIGGLGTYTDKRAWVSDVNDVLRTCKEKHLSITGVVEHKSTTPDETYAAIESRRGTVAPDLADRIAAAQAIRDPATRQRLRQPKEREKMRKEISERHGYKLPKV